MQLDTTEINLDSSLGSQNQKEKTCCNAVTMQFYEEINFKRFYNPIVNVEVVLLFFIIFFHSIMFVVIVFSDQTYYYNFNMKQY